MQPSPRYEIVDTIAAGDFATVYRGRDRDLGREVAIKQIHSQFLADPRQLARYWQEAQLLASLQHPNIVTIYDIARPQGWIILELMRGSLKQAAAAGPIDLDFLRAAMIGCLSGLAFLHSNGVIHGDVKPSNILIGPQNRVKLGDFGLARRASNEEGSLLKGTTKYMAPELLSAQFGAVGPASDLYSLGISAYELLCGDQFESLLPALTTYGRDKQLAWMMWHSTSDLKLPEIQKILQGVPDDLAQVIQKLVVKDQARRYQTAQDVIRDLGGGRQIVETAPDEIEKTAEEMAALAARRKRRKLTIVGLSMVLSVLLCTILLWPQKEPPKKQEAPPPVRGVVTAVYPDEFRLAYVSGEDGSAKERGLKASSDQIFINGKSAVLREVQPQDEIEFVELRDKAGRPMTQVNVTRPEIHAGIVRALKPGAVIIGIKQEGSDQETQLEVAVPSDLKIRFNERPDRNGRPVKLADIEPGDRAVVKHKAQDGGGRAATELSVRREVTTEGEVIGVLDDKATKGKVLKLAVVVGGKPAQEVLPFSDRCKFTVNNQPVAKATDLQKGDHVTVLHDTHILRVDGRRELQHEGAIETLDFKAQAIKLQGKDTRYTVGQQCKITLDREPITFEELRVGDTARIEHRAVEATAGQDVINALSVAAERPRNASRFALLIAGQNYDDKSLTPLTHALDDARTLGEALTRRYQLPGDRDHVLLLEDPSLQSLKGFSEWLKKIGPDAKLLVYVTGHAYRDDKGEVYLPSKEFQLQHPDVTGLPLQQLLEQLEACPAKEKLLLLDTCQGGTGADLKAQPSTAEMIQSLKGPPGQAALRTVTAIASCKKGQRGQATADGKAGLFASSLAAAYQGRADANRDNHLELKDELFRYLEQEMAKGGTGAQTPVYFEPNNKPPRLSVEAKDALRKLAAYAGQSKLDDQALTAAGRQLKAALQLAGNEPEPRLLYGLLLIKMKDHKRALLHLESMKIDYPGQLLPVEGLAWLRFDKEAYEAGVRELTELVNRVPPLKKPGEAYPLDVQHVFYWAGQLREFAAAGALEARRASSETLAALDASVAARGTLAEQRYQQGRERSAKKMAEFDEQIASASAKDGSEDRYRIERRQLNRYAEFPFERLVRQVVEGLDK